MSFTSRIVTYDSFIIGRISTSDNGLRNTVDSRTLRFKSRHVYRSYFSLEHGQHCQTWAEGLQLWLEVKASDFWFMVGIIACGNNNHIHLIHTERPNYGSDRSKLLRHRHPHPARNVLTIERNVALL